MVAGVQHYQAHAGQDVALYPVYDFVRHPVVDHMAPPYQHVRVRKHLFRQAALFIIQRSRAHLGLLIAQEPGYVGVEPAGIQLRHALLQLFVQILIPYCHFHVLSSILMPALRMQGSFPVMPVIPSCPPHLLSLL
jgi:hypothetical protein